MEPNFKVNMNEYLPLRDVVFNTLRQAILRGELKPGERLMEIRRDHREEYAGCPGSKKGFGRTGGSACM